MLYHCSRHVHELLISPLADLCVFDSLKAVAWDSPLAATLPAAWSSSLYAAGALTLMGELDCVTLRKEWSNTPDNAGDTGLIPGSGRSLEKELATHSSLLAWKIPRTGEPAELQYMGRQRVGHTERLCTQARKGRLLAPVLSPGRSHGQRTCWAQSRGSQRLRHDWGTNTHTLRSTVLTSVCSHPGTS